MPRTDYHQPMIYVAVALMVGIMVGNGVGMSVGLKPWAVVFCVLFVLACVGYRWSKWLCDVCLILSTMAFGAFLECRQTHAQASPLPEGRVSCEAIVVGMPQQHGKIVQTDAQIVIIGGRQLRHPMKARLSFLRDTLSGETASAPALGEGIAFSSRLQRPGDGYRINVNSHFDSRRWLLSQGYRVQTLIGAYDWQRVTLPLHCLGRADRVRLRVGKWRELLLDQYRRMGIRHDLGRQELSDQGLAKCLLPDRYQPRLGTVRPSFVHRLQYLIAHVWFVPHQPLGQLLADAVGAVVLCRAGGHAGERRSCCHHAVGGQHRFVAASPGRIVERVVLSGGDRAGDES